jgi:hypothetical protein
MRQEEKIKVLENLINQSNSFIKHSAIDSHFIEWKTMVELYLSRFFGEKSTQVLTFIKLKFRYALFDLDFSSEDSMNHIEQFTRDLSTSIGLLKQ